MWVCEWERKSKEKVNVFLCQKKQAQKMPTIKNEKQFACQHFGHNRKL